MITSIVFSRDRPLQLALCLDSIYENLPEEFTSCVSVLYNTSNTQYDKAYNLLNFESASTKFVREKNFINDLIYMIDRCKNDYVCFFTDDNIMYRKITKEKFKHITEAFDSGVLTFSLRLGLNITKRQHEQIFIQEILPDFQINSGYLTWYVNNIYHSYFGYPFSVDGHIYRRSEIKQFILELENPEKITNPNKLEAALQNILLPNYFLSCYPYSYVVNSPNNRVNISHMNRSGDLYPITTEDLLKMFLEGKRIDLSKIKFENIDCPHTEINILQGL